MTDRDLTSEQFDKLERWFQQSVYINPWTPRLQIQFLVRDELLTMDGKASLYQFGQWKRGGSDGNPIPWLNILTSGRTLYGPPPETFLPKITLEMLRAALSRELDYLRDEIDNPASGWRDIAKYRAYVVLTVCRILYTHKTGNIPSKPTAAAWAIDELPPELRSLVSNAHDPNSTISLAKIRRLIGHVAGVMTDV